MANNNAPKLSFSRPRDKSLEAYKEWINEMLSFLGGEDEQWTEEKWTEEWRGFWNI